VNVTGTARVANQEFALARRWNLPARGDGVLAAERTDRRPTDAAGRTPTEPPSRAPRPGDRSRAHLENNDAYPFFEALGDRIGHGRGHNVADLVIAWARKLLHRMMSSSRSVHAIASVSSMSAVRWVVTRVRFVGGRRRPPRRNRQRVEDPVRRTIANGGRKQPA